MYFFGNIYCFIIYFFFSYKALEKYFQPVFHDKLFVKTYDDNPPKDVNYWGEQERILTDFRLSMFGRLIYKACNFYALLQLSCKLT